MKSLNDRLVALAKAIQADGASRDSILSVEPRLWITSELPSPFRDYTQIPAGSAVADSFAFTRTITGVGVNPGANQDGPNLEPGLWRLRGHFRTDMVNAASNNLFSQMVLQTVAPAAGSILLAAHFNTGALNKSQLTLIDQVVSILIPGVFPRISSTATIGGETIICFCSVVFSRLL